MTRLDASVLHLLGYTGAYSEIWLDAQIRGAARFQSEAWRERVATQPFQWNYDPPQVKDQDPLAYMAIRLWRTNFLGGLLRPIAAFPSARATARMRATPDILHAHFGTIAWEWLGLIRQWAAPLVVSFYGFDASLRKYGRWPWVTRYKKLSERTSAVIVEGPAMARRVEHLGFPADRIHIVRLPFTNVELGSIDRREPEWDVIMAGRFVEKKGFDDGLVAFATAMPNRRLLLVGAGPKEGELRRRVHRLGIHDRVTFMKPVPLGELAELIAQSRVMIFPSKQATDGDGEGGAPTTLTLAQALGTPVIVTDHDDLPWAAVPGTPQVPAGDPAALASALVELDDGIEQGRHRDLVEDARHFVNREHDAARLVAAREAVYTEVLARV